VPPDSRRGRRSNLSNTWSARSALALGLEEQRSRSKEGRGDAASKW